MSKLPAILILSLDAVSGFGVPASAGWAPNRLKPGLQTGQPPAKMAKMRAAAFLLASRKTSSVSFNSSVKMNTNRTNSAVTTLADFPELAKLPKRQRLRLAEELWFSGIDDSLPVSAGHRTILDQRWKAYQSGRTKRLSLTELEQRLALK